MKPPGIITLITDFGLCDPFVGVMKGAILTRFPDARLVDLCHDLAPQAIDDAAFWIERAYRWFPRGTVHMVVVDPGVGSARRMLAIRAEEHYFVGPDNGVFARVWQTAKSRQAREIDPRRLGLRVPSATFHGRDVFGPVAAWLASWRLSFASMGAVVEPLSHEVSTAERTPQGIRGAVLIVDRYGNAFTNIDGSLIDPARDWAFEVNGHHLRLGRTYADAAVGECLALVNSFGVIEIAERNGSAARRLGIRPGDVVWARSGDPEKAQP